jgi:hypothetical protein
VDKGRLVCDCTFPTGVHRSSRGSGSQRSTIESWVYRSWSDRRIDDNFALGDRSKIEDDLGGLRKEAEALSGGFGTNRTMGGTLMSEGFWVVIGMSIAYVASFAGLIFAWIHYKKRQKENVSDSNEVR